MKVNLSVLGIDNGTISHRTKAKGNRVRRKMEGKFIRKKTIMNGYSL